MTDGQKMDDDKQNMKTEVIEKAHVARWAFVLQECSFFKDNSWQN